MLFPTLLMIPAGLDNYQTQPSMCHIEKLDTVKTNFIQKKLPNWEGGAAAQKYAANMCISTKV